jgi:hypothetical protein
MPAKPDGGKDPRERQPVEDVANRRVVVHDAAPHEREHEEPRAARDPEQHSTHSRVVAQDARRVTRFAVPSSPG